ncbi:MAG: TlpA family protein disulfide reductase [Acidobacteriota bacterium]
MSRLRRVLVILAGMSILLSGFAAPAQRRRGAAKRAPVVTVVDADALAAILKPNPVTPRLLLLNFWATWCEPCRDEFPELIKIDRQFRPQKLEFIAVSLDDLSDRKTAVPKFLREMGLTAQSYLLHVADPELAMSRVDPEWSGALPATFLYDGQGKLVYKRLGRIKPEELTAEIEKLVGNNTVMSNR